MNVKGFSNEFVDLLRRIEAEQFLKENHDFIIEILVNRKKIERLLDNVPKWLEYMVSEAGKLETQSKKWRSRAKKAEQKLELREQQQRLANLRAVGIRPRSGQARNFDTLQSLLELDPTEFEKVIAKLYDRLGCQAWVTSRTRDGGIDVNACSSAPGYSGKYAIQCKRYGTARKVSRAEVQKLLGCIAADKSFTKAVFITTSHFSSEARKFARGNGRLELIDGKTLVGMIESHIAAAQTAV